MKKSEFVKLITQKLRHVPTQGQKKAIVLFADYLCCKEKEALMLLKGYAGTGKTSLVSAFVQALREIKVNTVLLAPTGRAAKVLGNYSYKQAFTIHKEIYKIKYEDGNERIVLRENEHKNTIFFVDEASMIYDVQPLDNAMSLFQDTNLLYNLFSYVEQGANCRLVLIGDTAQLPPVGLQYSPALDEEFLRDNFSKLVFNSELKEVVRQARKSGILYNATKIRSLLGKETSSSPYQFVLDKFDDIASIVSCELLENLASAYQKYDMENVVVVTRSNKQANMLNQTIRNNILYREGELERGDCIMNLKNDYFWLPKNAPTQFIANGDIMEIVRVYNIEERYGFHFADVKVRLVDYEMEDIDLKLILESIYVESAAMTNESRRQLFAEVCVDYEHILPQKKRFQEIKKDPFLNALQIKFAYAQTCHKTQGGQWDNVFIIQGYINENIIWDEYYRWLYTAVTRTKKQLFVVM